MVGFAQLYTVYQNITPKDIYKEIYKDKGFYQKYTPKEISKKNIHFSFRIGVTPTFFCEWCYLFENISPKKISKRDIRYIFRKIYRISLLDIFFGVFFVYLFVYIFWCCKM